MAQPSALYAAPVPGPCTIDLAGQGAEGAGGGCWGGPPNLVKEFS